MNIVNSSEGQHRKTTENDFQISNCPVVFSLKIYPIIYISYIIYRINKFIYI